MPGSCITYDYTPYSNSSMVITWKPKLSEGRYVVEVLVKDASRNFFDSTSSLSVFNVYNHLDLLQVYNYSKPFLDNANFTFELEGTIHQKNSKTRFLLWQED